MVGALLLGARFAIDVSEDPKVAGDTVIVDTVRVLEGAPSVGHRPSELLVPWQPEAVLLGVIRDQTPEVVEYDGDRPLAAGDRVAIAARKDQQWTRPPAPSPADPPGPRLSFNWVHTPLWCRRDTFE